MDNESEEIIEASDEEGDDQEEFDPGEDMFIQSIFSDDDPADVSESEKEEKGFNKSNL